MIIMKKVLLVLLLLSPLMGCVSREVRDVIRSKHATSHVLRGRLVDDDPTNDPTKEQLKSFMISTAKDWESMDRAINNWKPKQGSMKSVNLEGEVDE